MELGLPIIYAIYSTEQSAVWQYSSTGVVGYSSPMMGPIVRSPEVPYPDILQRSIWGPEVPYGVRTFAGGPRHSNGSQGAQSLEVRVIVYNSNPSYGTQAARVRTSRSGVADPMFTGLRFEHSIFNLNSQAQLSSGLHSLCFT